MQTDTGGLSGNSDHKNTTAHVIEIWHAEQLLKIFNQKEIKALLNLCDTCVGGIVGAYCHLCESLVGYSKVIQNTGWYPILDLTL